MQWLRTIPHFVRVLVGLFVVAQFAGVVSSPLASARSFSTAVAFHIDHHHALHNDGQGTVHHHGDQSKDGADHCCALHAFFAGVLPPLIAVDTVIVRSQRLAAALADTGLGVASGPLERPPRPLPVI
jgi:hypothetical protein